jgi:hypothetical protein
MGISGASGTGRFTLGERPPGGDSKPVWRPMKYCGFNIALLITSCTMLKTILAIIYHFNISCFNV